MERAVEVPEEGGREVPAAAERVGVERAAPEAGAVAELISGPRVNGRPSWQPPSGLGRPSFGPPSWRPRWRASKVLSSPPPTALGSRAIRAT